MTVTDAIKDAVAISDTDEFDLPHPLAINIRPILDSVAGKLTDDEIDDWFVGFARANEGRGFYLELTAEGELVITPMVNMDSTFAEAELTTDLGIWSREYGGRVSGPRGIVRLPGGARTEPDAAWLSDEQMAQLPPISASRPITVCPAFVAEIMSSTDRLPPLRRKMEQYIASGAQLGWLIDPYHQRVHIYRPGMAVEILDNPETISGESVLPGFTFDVRRRIFDLHAAAE